MTKFLPNTAPAGCCAGALIVLAIWFGAVAPAGVWAQKPDAARERGGNTGVLVGADSRGRAAVSMKFWLGERSALTAGIGLSIPLFDNSNNETTVITVDSTFIKTTSFTNTFTFVGPFAQYEWHFKTRYAELSPYLGARLSLPIGRTMPDEPLGVLGVETGGSAGVDYFFTPYFSVNAQTSLLFQYGKPDNSGPNLPSAGFLTIRTSVAFAVYF